MAGKRKKKSKLFWFSSTTFVLLILFFILALVGGKLYGWDETKHIMIKYAMGATFTALLITLTGGLFAFIAYMVSKKFRKWFRRKIG